MKRILVYNVAASDSGALSILTAYYHKLSLEQAGDTEYIFVVSTPMLSSMENITVLRYPWVKKSWLHRLYFDYFCIDKIVSNYQVDEILSLQNIAVPNVATPQTIYLHQSLPFVQHRFSITESPILWIYQKIISRLIYRSVKKAYKVIVQTHWMKDACIKKVGISAEKIVVESPRIDISNIKEYRQSTECIFLYPATALIYKNHQVILEACKLLKQQGICHYKVVFTILGEENKLAATLKRCASKWDLPVDFAGMMKRKALFELYAKSILLFPSYVETFGLPLLEAKETGCFIIAADTGVNREVLTAYDNCEFFSYKDSKILANIMLNKINELGIIND